MDNYQQALDFCRQLRDHWYHRSLTRIIVLVGVLMVASFSVFFVTSIAQSLQGQGATAIAAWREDPNGYW